MEKFVENCRISQKFGISRGIWTKYMSNSVKKSFLVLKLCHFKKSSVSGCHHENSYATSP